MSRRDPYETQGRQQSHWTLQGKPGPRPGPKAFGETMPERFVECRDVTLMKLEFEKCPCDECLEAVTACFTIAGEASVYRATPGYREGGRFSRRRQGFGGYGEGRVCWNLCNGSVDLQAQAGAFVFINLGFERFNRQIDISWQTEPYNRHLGNVWAPLRGKGICCGN